MFEVSNAELFGSQEIPNFGSFNQCFIMIGLLVEESSEGVFGISVFGELKETLGVKPK
jgi:hypothetical protein